MRPVVVALLGLGVACGAGDDGPTIPDPYTRPSLGSANPGVQLSVHAPQSYAEWPVIGWDLEHNALVLPDRPREAPTNLVRLDLDHHTTALLRTAPNGVQELHTGGSGTVLFSSTAGKLSSSDAEIAPI